MTLRYRILPSERLAMLKLFLQTGRKLRIMEAHDGLSALIANTSVISREQSGKVIESHQFDGLWVSSLTDSAAKGHPDTGVVDVSSRLQTIQEIALVTNKLIIVDGDTGGESSQFEYFCSKLECLGVSAVVIEDKQYPKRNSLELGAIQHLEDPKVFAKKINRAKEACLSKEFMIFARIESFIAGYDLKEAIKRAEIYLNSQADGIFIHSNLSSPNQIYQFIDGYYELCAHTGIKKPLMCVPTTYNQIYDHELFSKGIDVVIYANHNLRAAHKAMRQVSNSILAHGRSFEATPYLSSVKEIFEDVGFLDVTAKDAQDEEKQFPIIILSAGKTLGFIDTKFKDQSICNVNIKGKKLIDRQLDVLKNLGLNDITLIIGKGEPQIKNKQLHVIHNKDYTTTKSLFSLLLAEEKIKQGFILIFGDIIFEEELLRNLSKQNKDVVIVVDPTINLKAKKQIKSSTDLVVSANYRASTLRKLNMDTERVIDIGTDIDPSNADYEFIGIAKFSPHGAELLLSIYHSLCNKKSIKIEKNTKNILQYDISDILREMLVQGCSIEAMIINKGWAEIHNPEDISNIEGLIK